ncbi:hypothetical protein [Herbaspirillum sp. B65]|uniref:hypothetical protein n=1 Tax=Herbaspirillum sp. B65 TaxID=137708 RepID=UPI0005CB17A8|nr:hypothetical protein [Herbaspirillum sp. B65]
MDLLTQISEKTDDLRVTRERLMRELALIDAELKKLEAAKEVFLSFINPPISTKPAVRHPVGSYSVTIEGFAEGVRTASKRDRILFVADELLKDGFPRTTEEILSKLDEAGVQLSGGDEKTQLRNLSAYLSKAKAELQIESTKYGWVKKPIFTGYQLARDSDFGKLPDLVIPQNDDDKDAKS